MSWVDHRAMQLQSESFNKWVPIRSSDLLHVNAIADRVHKSLPERPEVFAEKISLSPQTSRKLIHQGEMVGYGIAHPWMLDSIPPLDGFLTKLPEKPNCMYIHDVVVLPEARGHGAAGSYISLIKDISANMGISTVALVSVYGTNVLWSRYGFAIRADERISKKLASYGKSATYMTCAVR
jgi:ribosomal protein S18 acetylase RimI-like enzyme